MTLSIEQLSRWDEHFIIQQSAYFFITLLCVLGVVLQTILDVYIYNFNKETVCKKCLMIPEWLPQAVIRGRTGQRKGTFKKINKRTNEQNKNKTKNKPNNGQHNTTFKNYRIQ